MRVIYDIRGAQTLHHPERGIARYVSHHAAALAARPEVDELAGLVDDRPLPPVAALLAERGRLVALAGLSGERLEPPLVHHIGSLFELELPLRDLIPPPLARRGVVRAVTLFDVIPLVYRDALDGWAARAWRYRAELVRSADLVCCISEFTAQDGIERLGLDPERVAVIGTGVPPVEAQPPGSPPALDGLRAPFLLYAGGTEHPRKNLPRLIRAFARLPEAQREAHQLVIVGRLADAARPALEAEARAAGVAERVLLPGFVPDEALRRLYGSCALFVYPSEYEGFGLPIAEAMSHGAPVVASRASSCGELTIDERATFDPHDTDAIAGAVSRALGDPELVGELRRRGPEMAARHTWEAVAERTAAAYRRALERAGRGRRWTREPSLGAVSFTPPAVGAPSGALVLLAAALSADAEVHAITPGLLRPRHSGFTAHEVEQLEVGLQRVEGELVVLVDSHWHLGRAAELLRRHPGVAVLWELDLVLGREPALMESLLAAARAVIVSTPFDAARLRLAHPLAEERVHVLAPPLGWVAHQGRLGHMAPLEVGLMERAPRRVPRAARPVPLAVAPRPPRLGAFGAEELERLADLAIALAARGRRTQVGVLGDAEPERVDAAARRCAANRAGGLLTWSRWPADMELVAWCTAASLTLDLAGGGPSASEAAIDFGLLAHGRPVLSLSEVGDRSARVVRLPSWASAHEVVEAAAALLDRPDEPPEVPARRRPREAARDLLGLLRAGRTAARPGALA